MVFLEKKKRNLIILLILIIIFIIFYYKSLPKLHEKYNLAIENEKCIPNTCNSANNKEYCLDEKWAECLFEQACIDGICVKQNEIIGDGGESTNNKENAEKLQDSFQYSVLIKKQGTGFGNIKVEGYDFNCGIESEQCVFNYNENLGITLTAEPVLFNSKFDRWEGCKTINENTCIITNENNAVIASFSSLPEDH